MPSILNTPTIDIPLHLSHLLITQREILLVNILTALTKDDPCCPCFPYLPNPHYDWMCHMVHMHLGKNHLSWKKSSLGRSGSIPTLPLDEGYKVFHLSYHPPQVCPLKTACLMVTSLCPLPSMSSLWCLWLSISCSSFGTSSTKALRLKISHPLPLCHHHRLPPCPQRKMVLSLHMKPHFLPVPCSPWMASWKRKKTRRDLSSHSRDATTSPNQLSPLPIPGTWVPHVSQVQMLLLPLPCSRTWCQLLPQFPYQSRLFRWGTLNLQWQNHGEILKCLIQCLKS